MRVGASRYGVPMRREARHQHCPVVEEMPQDASNNDKDALCYVAVLNCVGAVGFQSVRRAAAASLGAFIQVTCSGGSNTRHATVGGAEREAPVAGHQEVAGSWQVQHRSSYGAVLPNPSLKARPNGGSPGPGRRYAVHYLHPGPGAPPSAPP